MKKLFLLILPFLSLGAIAQTTISGKVTDKKGEALPFANIQVAGTYDGTSANENGLFNFNTDASGNQKLLVTMVGYNPFSQDLVIGSEKLELEIKLEESINSLNAVVVTAGMFEASDEKKMVMLKPLDIVTTAGGGADIVAVMQYLPGANRVGETEGLFVRGGSASETKTVIDGMIVQNPFFSSTPDVPQRGRFTPFMFKGTAFSTGGYSALYGQALSSVLLLNTVDKQGDNSNLSLNAHMAGVGASYTHKGWLTGMINYTNLSPFFSLVKTNINFDKVPQGLGTSLTVNQDINKTSTIKAYITYTDNESALQLPTYEKENETYIFSNRNKNIFGNASYRSTYNEGKWILLSGLSYSKNTDQLIISANNADRIDERTQARVVMSRLFGNSQSSSFNFGAEYHHIEQSNLFNQFTLSLKDNYSAIFAESEFYINPKLAGRLGLRAENTSIINKSNLAPRLSVAYKTGQFSQFSLAAGRFYQNPEKEYLYLNKNLDFELADHLIINYQIIKNLRTFRVEGFEKRYHSLIVEETEIFDPNPYRFPTGSLSNTGKGYARGFDVFFRDQKSIPQGDLWITYSYLDTERQFKNYTETVVPYFASKHNFSVVYKQFINAISTNVGATFSHTSGRPIYAYKDDFKNIEYTKAFQNLSLSASHIKMVKNQFIVFYATLDNVLARKNVYGYRYSADGTQRFEVKPPIYRTFFFGVSWTFGKLNGRSREADLDF